MNYNLKCFNSFPWIAYAIFSDFLSSLSLQYKVFGDAFIDLLLKFPCVATLLWKVEDAWERSDWT